MRSAPTSRPLVRGAALAAVATGLVLCATPALALEPVLPQVGSSALVPPALVAPVLELVPEPVRPALPAPIPSGGDDAAAPKSGDPVTELVDTVLDTVAGLTSQGGAGGTDPSPVPVASPGRVAPVAPATPRSAPEGPRPAAPAAPGPVSDTEVAAGPVDSIGRAGAPALRSGEALARPLLGAPVEKVATAPPAPVLALPGLTPTPEAASVPGGSRPPAGVPAVLVVLAAVLLAAVGAGHVAERQAQRRAL